MKFDITHAVAAIAVLAIVYKMGQRNAVTKATAAAAPMDINDWFGTSLFGASW